MRVTLKLATSLDGRIATASGESKWITGEAAREEVHRLRAIHKLIMVGVETVIADDPMLDVRLSGAVSVGRGPIPVVLDTSQRIPLSSKLVTDAQGRGTTVISTQPAKEDLREAGVDVLTVTSLDNRVDPSKAIEALEARGSQSLMIEGGGQVAASFLAAGLVDAIEWFRAPIVLGDEGRPGVGEFVLKHLAEAPRFKRTGVQELGEDLWERYERA